MTCYLFWVAPPATPQPKIPPHPQPRATCFFDGRNSQAQAQLYQILIVPQNKACNFSFNFYSVTSWISQIWTFWVKTCFHCKKSSIFELQNCNLLTLLCFIVKKTCKVVIAYRIWLISNYAAHSRVPKTKDNGTIGRSFFGIRLEPRLPKWLLYFYIFSRFWMPPWRKK